MINAAPFLFRQPPEPQSPNSMKSTNQHIFTRRLRGIPTSTCNAPFWLAESQVGLVNMVAAGDLAFAAGILLALRVHHISWSLSAEPPSHLAPNSTYVRALIGQ